ncbi:MULTISPECIES: UDP-glucose dehydrogenase family protein [Pseudomonas]|uniref:UDP-glucose 6-dehydrogenase n=1 Tax=Pseudomonas plecoglossicida TaxID=70775 RepID=A0ABX4TWT7_PSEDL|nr:MULTISPECIES: UDP-glucose/GDP-mannose dehydrogenase family protein [Pseudomonas]PLU84363.1 UDP-glucose 6-dehydrogenase [Pseudomonas plecoglossicida]PLU89629.1 UDP-glucose 6-dehydrogenase [Pseudomonas plecoglossicida]PLU97684.1 UDP-glucose 6-dehydrogenase [Pseudomonas plecoglossicida]PLV07730.1 UDP-glucose 6-dehydrogenase [Pseudomonas plecoglossicida]
MKITVFGSGYVGLVTGTCLADVGHHVVCVDVDQRKIDGLKKGIIPIYEPGLDDMVRRNVQEGRLDFTTDANMGVSFGEIQFIAVGTPPDEDGSADLKYVLAVAQTIGQHMTEPKIVVDKSTVPVGTADKVKEAITRTLASRGVELQFDVCSNPEFLKEGAALEDFTKGARIVVGTDSDHVRRKMRECYAPYSRNHDKLIFMDVRSAELTKYAANGMLATKISFMNELSNLAERLGADIEQVRIGIGSDPRIGYSFIYPGCGYGGSCFPKDVQALYRTAQEVGYSAELLAAVEGVNKRQKDKMFASFADIFNGQLEGKTIAVWGLAFKPNTDDMRDAPSRRLIEQLWQAGAKVRVFDPKAMEEFERIYGERADTYYATTQDEALEGADALAICTEWKSFRAVDPHMLRGALSSAVVVDGRNLFDPLTMAQAGVAYHAIGRPYITPGV